MPAAVNEFMEELEEIKDSRRQKMQRRISALVTVLLILVVLLCVYVAVQVFSNGYVNFGGYTMFRVVTGSMEPTIPTGALLVAQQTDIADVQVNDIICFMTQDAQIWGKIVTHRVVEILNMADGSVLLRTQGDANLVADGYFVDQENIIGKVFWHTGDGSVLASVFSFFTNKVGFLGCIVLPCLLLAGLILKESVSNIHYELKNAMEELETSNEEDEKLLLGMTQQEYDEMYERIRTELMEELMHCAEISETE